VKIQRESVRNLARKLFGIQGESSPEDVEDYVLGICELGRRGEFELLREQGIVAWHASRGRTPAAGQIAHCYAMASLIGGVRYNVILERVEFGAASTQAVLGFQGTSLGATNSAVVLARDFRHTVDARTDFSALVQVQDGESAVAPPAVGVQNWSGRTVTNVLAAAWHGPILIPHIDEFAAVQAQQAFQGNVAAARVEYTMYGYLVPVAGDV